MKPFSLIREKPDHLLIIGGGPVGVEMAQAHARLGCDVTLVEAFRIMGRYDPALVDILKQNLIKAGITLIEGVSVTSLSQTIKSDRRTITAVLANGKQLTTSHLLMAVGRKPALDGLQLAAAKIRHDAKGIVTDRWLRTSNRHVYAIGDVTGPPWLAHKASHEGIICVEKITGQKDVHAISAGAVPGCTYCRPQVASVGMTEAAAKQAGHDLKIGQFPFAGNGKAIALGDDGGFVKTIFDAKTGELLGAHMVGPEVTELIQGYAIARTLEATEAELMATIFPHPTLSEAMHEAVLDAYDRAIHF